MHVTRNSTRAGSQARHFLWTVVTAALIVVVASCSSANTATKSSGSSATQNLPLTFDEAKAQGKKVDFGPNCDTTTGKIKVPSVYAPPCVAPVSGGNGGATSPGVTKDEITVAVYQIDPKLNPLQAAVVKGAGADVDLATAKQTFTDFSTYYSAHYPLWGRKVRLVFVKGSGAPNDTVASKADAIKIATEINPFAVWDGPGQDGGAFAAELATRHILCLGPCALAIPEAQVHAEAPYVWGIGPSPEQAAVMTAEMVGKEFGKGTKAAHAGDPAMRTKTRVYGVAHYDTPTGQQRPAFDKLVSELHQRGVTVTTDVSYLLDLTKVQDTARTLISKFRDAGVTTVILTGDPLTPEYLTKEATAQNYFPEWIIGPNVYIDTAVFGRAYEQRQWMHAFGLELNPARGQQSTQDSYNLYTWQFGHAPPNNTYAVINISPSIFFLGVELAGPNLTPQTFQQGLFRSGVRGGGPTTPVISWGHHGIWPELDLDGSDDAALIWWNPNASGQDEIGNQGKGLYEYANGGRRYLPGHWPTTDSGLYDPSTSVTIFQTVPAGDQPPSYPSPAGK